MPWFQENIMLAVLSVIIYIQRSLTAIVREELSAVHLIPVVLSGIATSRRFLIVIVKDMSMDPEIIQEDWSVTVTIIHPYVIVSAKKLLPVRVPIPGGSQAKIVIILL